MKTIYNTKGESFKYFDDYCLQTCPCQHSCIKHNEQKSSLLYGSDIYNYLSQNDYDEKDFEHFIIYKDFNLKNH